MLIIPDNKFLKAWLIQSQSPTSVIISINPDQHRPSEKHLALNRFHLRLNGASTLTRRKKGRRRNCSNMRLSQISMMTHRSSHLFVTNSIRSSIVWKTREDLLSLLCTRPASADCNSTSPNRWQGLGARRTS